MILFASLGYLISVYLGWWVVPIWSFAIGFMLPKGLKGLGQVCLSAFLVWALVAYYKDGQSLGLISLRLSEMFHIPRWGIYVLTGFLGALIAAPAYLLGANVKRLSLR